MQYFGKKLSLKEDFEDRGIDVWRGGLLISARILPDPGPYLQGIPGLHVVSRDIAWLFIGHSATHKEHRSIPGCTVAAQDEKQWLLGE
jgi:hypothetical protein